MRPVSGVCANLVIYTAFARPGDSMFSLSIPNGGHISYGKEELGGTAGSVRGIRVEYFPFDPEEMNIDVGKTKEKLKRMVEEGRAPKLAMFGASVFLFPHPVKELADVFHDAGMLICYDAAHVAGLIAGGQFQDPLREGADLVTASTHKTLFGPQGGLVLSWNKHADKVKRATFPGNTSNHHLHSVAGKAVALAEMLEFGEEYAHQVIRNAKALAQALHERGLKVFGERKGFTQSHTVLVNVTEHGDGGTLERELEGARIVANRNMIPGDIKAGRHYMNPGGLRFGVSEVTRLGMRESEMSEIAGFIERIVIRRESQEKVARDVGEFRKQFTRTRFCFEPGEAYRYVKIR